MRKLFLASALLLTLALLAACGGGGDSNSDNGDGGEADAFPQAGNSELVLGANRFAVALIDTETNDPILLAEGTSVHLRFLQDDEVKIDSDATFVWAIPDSNGFWTADVEFEEAGPWSLEVDAVRDGEDLTVAGATFNVLAESRYVNIGDEAPATENLTLETQPNIKKVSTDTDPDLALYQLTVADALDEGKPIVVVFATPAYCQTRFCGPVVDNVKEVRPEFADAVNFIHIEPFQLDDDGQLIPGTQGTPVTAPPMQEWRLQSEPWVFVVGADGRVAQRFEGAVSVDELRAAIEGVLG
jgi:hypothetical protein